MGVQNHTAVVAQHLVIVGAWGGENRPASMLGTLRKGQTDFVVAGCWTGAACCTVGAHRTGAGVAWLSAGGGPLYSTTGGGAAKTAGAGDGYLPTGADSA